MVGWRFISSHIDGEVTKVRHWLTSKGPAMCSKYGSPPPVPVGDFRVQDDDEQNCRVCQNILKRTRDEIPALVMKYLSDVIKHDKEREAYYKEKLERIKKVIEQDAERSDG